MTNQSNEAAERSAHVTRGDKPPPAEWPVVRTSDGSWKLKSIAALEARIAKLEALVKEAFGEGFEMGKEDGKELGEFLANGGDARRYETFGFLEHWQSSNSRAALGGKDE